MQRCKTSLLLLASFLVPALTSSPGQTSAPASTPDTAPQPRLLRSLAGQKRVPLPGSAPPDLLLAADRGPVPDTTPLHGLTLVFRRSDAQQADLQQLLLAQQTPGSPEFHHWLTPETFGRRFGVAPADLDLTRDWLGQQGFTVSSISNAHDRITFSGTAAQVRAAFGTSLHHVQFDGEAHIVPTSAVSLPADLASITLAVTHLSDLRPKPSARLAPRPAYTTGPTSAHYLTPVDLAVMYNLPQSSDNFSPGDAQTIAIVGQSYIDLSPGSAVSDFRASTYGGGAVLTPVLVPGTGVQAAAPGDQAESEIDVEYASGLALSANILFVYVGSDPHSNVFDALSFTIDQNLAPVVSISYSACEALLSPTDLQQGNALFEQAALQGQTLVAAAGDSGSTACARYAVSASLTSTQQQALAVGYPADSPYVTAVGGTQMAAGTFSPGTSPYWAPTPYPTEDISKSLLSYVPEIAWNEDSPTRGLFAGGGGASTAFPRPTWQTSFPGIPAGTTRLLPDIALQASAANPGFLFCSDDQTFVGQNVSGCALGSSPPSSYPVAGGTSFAAPTFAAMVAVINQSTLALGQGTITPLLYQLAANPATAAAVFHDITSGTIACTPGTPRCSTAGQSGFAATVGYDEATGLGSFDLGQLLAALPPTNPDLQPTTLVLEPYSTTANPGDTVSIRIVAQSASPAIARTPPSSGVSVSIDGALIEPALAFTDINSSTFEPTASVLYNVTAPATPGSHTVSVLYPGDSTHSPALGIGAILVGNVTATGSLTLFSSGVTLPANGTAQTTVNITPTGYTGRLVWSLSLTGDNPLSACYQIPEALVQGVATSATLTLGAGTACNAPLPSSRTAPRSLTVQSLHATIQPLHANSRPARRLPWPTLPATATLLLVGLRPTRRRRALPSLCLLLLSLTAATTTLTGCGGSSNNGGGTNPINPTPTSSTYTATLTARDSVNGSVTANTSFVITVP